MPTAAHHSRIVVVDSSRPGESLPHSMYSIVYVPSWLITREKFDWTNIPKTLGIMKEYFISASLLERPIRAQRCMYSMKAVNMYSPGRYPKEGRQLYETLYSSLRDYLVDNPVVAWDWIVTWTECRELAEKLPNDFIRLFRKFRSRKDTKGTPKPELAYFLIIMNEVADEYHIDTEHN